MWFKMASDLLTFCRDLDTAPPLCVRFVDALAWYGEAVAECSTAAKIVKFVSAIERLVCTGKEHDAEGKVLPLAEIVVARAAIFYSRGPGATLVEARTQFERIYDSRSRIVHGSISPFDECLRSIASKTEEVTRMVLLAGLDFFTSLGIDDPRFKEKQLKEQYARLVAEASTKPNPVNESPFAKS
jgi:hypothetical protein